MDKGLGQDSTWPWGKPLWIIVAPASAPAPNLWPITLPSLISQKSNPSLLRMVTLSSVVKDFLMSKILRQEIEMI